VTLLTKVIAGDEALAAFRQGLTGPHALSLLDASSTGLLVQLPVGVGKTGWLVKIIEHALNSAAHDLVVVLVPRRDILRELLSRIPSWPAPTRSPGVR
jgi:late competence protein required for DNA uptake (superfamily II DNA/RNA helicase)